MSSVFPGLADGAGFLFAFPSRCLDHVAAIRAAVFNAPIFAGGAGRTGSSVEIHRLRKKVSTDSVTNPQGSRQVQVRLDQVQIRLAESRGVYSIAQMETSVLSVELRGQSIGEAYLRLRQMTNDRFAGDGVRWFPMTWNSNNLKLPGRAAVRRTP